MNRILITGIAGFVGKHLLHYLSQIPGLNILGIDMQQLKDVPAGPTGAPYSYLTVDMLDSQALFQAVAAFRPEGIIHLASSSSVAYSWQEPVASFRNNTNIFLNLADVVRSLGLKCRILSVGSSEEYGIVDNKDLPLREDAPVNPVSPYAVARVTQDLLSRVYVNGYGQDIIITRSFNHTGPGQSTRFFIPSAASQIMHQKNEKKNGPLIIRAGDMSIIRDFTDVRDVVRAYWLLMNEGRTGQVYNVCSGNGFSLKEVIDMMARIAGTEVRVETDFKLIRPADNPVIIGSNKKIHHETGWKPEIPLEQSLKDVLDDAGNHLNESEYPT